MYRIHSRRAIINRKSLVSDLQELCGTSGRSPQRRAETLHIVKRALSHGAGEIRRRLENRESDGPTSVRAQAYLIDQLIRSIYDVAASHVFPQPDNPQALSLAATGGYGRSELAPFSDIDLLFLVPGKCNADNERLIEYLLYMLWDAGLKVGHATRTIDENIRLSKKDLSICTSLLEARWLWGDEALFKQFITRFYADVVRGSGRQYVERKLAERDDRHERMGDSRYVLEPHIKEGKGGCAICRRSSGSPNIFIRWKTSGSLRNAASLRRTTCASSAKRDPFCSAFAVICTMWPGGPRNA